MVQLTPARRRARLALLLLIAGAALYVALSRPPSATAWASLGPSANLVRGEELLAWQALPVLRTDVYEAQSSTQHVRGDYPWSWLSRGLLRGSPALFSGNRDMNNFRCRGQRLRAHPLQAIPFEVERQSCPEDHIEGLVLARFEGPGVLGRIWLTLLSLLERAPSETLRVYVDDRREPVAALSVRALLEAGGAPLLRAPFSLEAQHAVSWHPAIAYSKRAIVSVNDIDRLQAIYYEISASHRAESRTLSTPNEVSMRAMRLARAPSAAAHTERAFELQPGEHAELALPGPATITALRIRLAKQDLDALRSCTLRVRWDGQNAAIDLPLSDLFNASRALPMHASEALRARWDGADTELELSLPMPFASSAVLVLDNRGPGPLALTMTLEHQPGVPPEPWGHLHVQRYETAGTPPPAYHPLADVRGRGRLVGLCAQLEGAVGAEDAPFFLEGDVERTVDGRVQRGTGTEDYFDGAFFFADGQAASPFHQVFGQAQRGETFEVSACRWHVLTDAIDFSDRFSARLEIGPTTRVRYVSLAYLYREPSR